MRRDFLSGMEVSNEKDASQREGSFPVTRKLSSEPGDKIFIGVSGSWFLGERSEPLI